MRIATYGLKAVPFEDLPGNPSASERSAVVGTPTEPRGLRLLFAAGGHNPLQPQVQRKRRVLLVVMRYVTPEKA